MLESYQLTPSTPLRDGETVLQSFQADKAAYYRGNAWLAAGAMAAGMVILYLMGNPHVWTGAVGGLLAIAIRAFYVASDELGARWDLTNQRLLGPQTRAMNLSDIKEVNTLGSAVQVVTNGGDKHLLKYQADRDATKGAILSAKGSGS